MELSVLVALLQDFKIPCEEWGTGTAKTVDHLLNEINSGETTLSICGHLLQRTIKTAIVSVFYIPKPIDLPDRLRLVEERQVFNNGRQRTRETEGSLAEKLKPGETAPKAALRALKEELSLDWGGPLTPIHSTTSDPSNSQSYPGLQTIYIKTYFHVQLPVSLYKADGYIETQPDKTTYFVWRPVIHLWKYHTEGMCGGLFLSGICQKCKKTIVSCAGYIVSKNGCPTCRVELDTELKCPSCGTTCTTP